MAIHEFQHGGQRFDSNAVDLDQLARNYGFESFAAMQDQSPASASALQFQNGGGNGTTYQSAASDDELHTGRLLAMLAATEFGGGFAQLGGAAAPAAAQAAASLPGAAGTAAPLAATIGVPAGLPAGILLAAPGAEAASTAAAGGLGFLGPSGAYTTAAGDVGTSLAGAGLTGAGGSSTLGTIGSLLRGAGSAFGAASNADANNTGESNREQLALAQLMLEASRADQTAYSDNATIGQNAWNANSNAGLSAFNANTTADNSFQGSLISRGRLEDDQRQRDILNLFKDSKARNPNIGPYDMRGPSALSPEYLSALRNVGTQASTELAHAPVYSAAGMPALNQRVYTPPAPYQAPAPYVPHTFTPPNLQTPGSSTLSRIGQWLGPGLVAASGLVGGR